MTDLDIDGPRDDDELARFARHAAASFNIPEGELLPWLADLDSDQLFALRSGGELVAGCIGFPTGHYLWGAPVSSLGIALVFVAPHQRGRGLSTQLMNAVLAKARRDGYALSTLHPARLRIYRRVGYELAGSLFEHRIKISSLGHVGIDDDLSVTELGNSDNDEVEGLFSELAPLVQGALVRESYLWRRVRRHRSAPASGYGVRDARGTLRGYFYMRRSSRPDNRFDLWLSDVWADSGVAYRAILSFLSGQASLAEEFGFCGSPAYPLVLELAENELQTKRVDQWMICVVDPRRALTQRGYPTTIDAAVDLEIGGGDALRLAVSEGQATLMPCRDTPATVSSANFAPLFSGLHSASELHRAGRLRASENAIAALDAIFMGPHPHMRQYF